MVSGICACLTIVSFNVNASIISVDRLSAGDNQITQDDVSGLEWLDLTVTTNLTYLEVGNLIYEPGGELEGWRKATRQEISGFFDAFGGDSAYYEAGLSTQNNGLFQAVAPFWGDIDAELYGGPIGEGGSKFYTADFRLPAGDIYVGLIKDSLYGGTDQTYDYINLSWSVELGGAHPEYGHALVRDISTVPVPTAVWLFGSGLLGLIGFARRKKV